MTPQQEIEQLKAQLAERDARWYALVEPIAQIVWATDANGRNVRDLQLAKAAPLSFGAFTGHAETSGDTARWLEAVHPDDVNNVVSTWSESLRSGQHYRCEYRLRHHSGEWRWMLFRGAPLHDANGIIVGWSGIGTDVTHRRQTEEALRESQQHLMAALEVGGIGIVVIRARDQTVWWDQAATQLWDVDPTQMDRSLEGVLSRHAHEDDRDKLRRALQESLNTKKPTAIEYRVKRRDGSIRWVAARGQLNLDRDGNPVQIISAHIDITKLKLAEESVRQAQTLQALGTLAGGVAHDFNNLLLAMSGNARLALDCRIDSDATLALNEIIKASDRATDLVRRVLTFSSQQPREQTSAVLCAAVKDALSLTQTSVPSSIEIQTNIKDESIAVSLGAAEIQQVVLNLVSNSIDAIGQRPGLIAVTVSLVDAQKSNGSSPSQAPKQWALLSIRDNGGGIDALTRERVFEPFFTTKPVGKGTGLGLAVVHGIVSSAGGRIEINSTLGAGTTVTVWLPLAARSELAPLPIAATKPAGRGEHILYVDDDDAIVLLITRSLQQLGYRVTGYTSAREALEQLNGNPDSFDVVVTDLSMPEMSGFDLAEQVKKLRPSLPIVMTSGYVRTQDQERAQHLGIEHIILKPNTIEELGQVLDKICRGISS